MLTTSLFGPMRGDSMVGVIVIDVSTPCRKVFEGLGLVDTPSLGNCVDLLWHQMDHRGGTLGGKKS